MTLITNVSISIIGLGAVPENTHIAMESAEGNSTILFQSKQNSSLYLENLFITYTIGNRSGPPLSWATVRVSGAASATLNRVTLGLESAGNITETYVLLASSLKINITNSNILVRLSSPLKLEIH
jgi:hypothetical protein